MQSSDSKTTTLLEVCHWSNLMQAWRHAAKGKRSSNATARFEYDLADNLLELQAELKTGQYRPGRYRQFIIHEPKRRIISAAPFRDRVVHHALCQVIEPEFEKGFIHDSFANRLNKGTHKAINRLQLFCKRFRYALQMDIVQHFECIDHQILLSQLGRRIKDRALLKLCQLILKGGEDLETLGRQHLFPDDDLIALTRPRGLPIGNLTSQFWSNCYLHPLDVFIKRELGCKGYLRYVDDFTLFSNSKKQLWQWKQRVIEKL